ncbi:hypothetical protein IQ243_03115 [Nostocales cyanobacterium LEGE 11386]|nr:hypothetical protein [Nostocales cyanobacterium LEGE 11386]
MPVKQGWLQFIVLGWEWCDRSWLKVAWEYLAIWVEMGCMGWGAIAISQFHSLFFHLI